MKHLQNYQGTNCYRKTFLLQLKVQWRAPSPLTNANIDKFAVRSLKQCLSAQNDHFNKKKQQKLVSIEAS